MALFYKMLNQSADSTFLQSMCIQLTIEAEYDIVGRAFSNAAAAADNSRWNWVLAHMFFHFQCDLHNKHKIF